MSNPVDVPDPVQNVDLPATADKLTGLLLRRNFLMLAEGEFERHRRGRRPLSLLIADIDFCKRINMCRGYSVGDQLIVQVANLCLAVKRESDIVARIGGEQFAILLSETDLNLARIIAERLRQMVEKTPLVTPAKKIAATVSIGLAETHPGTGGIAALMKEADEALYEAKCNGRNRVAHSRKQDCSV
jgi:diguanylate cyclase (GGDEF)-like protein